MHPQQLPRYPVRPAGRSARDEFLKDKVFDPEAEQRDCKERSSDRCQRQSVQRTIERKKDRTSATYSSGTLWAAKWPPWSYVFQ